MKICPECHKLSRDDDFCSYCGAAVFSADDVSDSRSIDCNTYDRGHDHNKITYDVSERGTNVRPPVPEVHAPELPSGNTSYSSYTGPVRRLPPEPQQYHSEHISSAQEAEDFVNDLLNGRRNSRRAPMSARDKKVLAVVVIFTLIILGKVIFGILAGFISMLEAF